MALERKRHRRLRASATDSLNYVCDMVVITRLLRPLWVRLLGGKRPLVAGQSTELVCQAVGARPKPNISWWKGGTRLKTVRETTSSDGNMTSSILTFVPSIKDAGRVLSCRAVQPRLALSTHEDGWKLEIQHMPVVKLELGANLDADKVIEGSDVYLDCMVRANPWHSHVYFTHNEPMSYQWWFNSTTHSKLELNSFTTNTQNNIGRYLYTVNSSSDYGWIQCTGTNSVGTQSTPCLFHILPAEKPSLVKNCEITNMTYDSLSLCCSPGHDGGLRQSFLLQVYDISSGVLLRNITSEEPQFIVWGLSGSNVVSISVKAFNKKGSSEPFTLTSNLLKHPQRHTDMPVVKLELGANLDADKVIEGSDVYLDCMVRANPWHSHVYFTHNEPMSYQWWFNSTTHSKLELNSFTTNTQNNIGRYLYTVNSSSDYGWIQCTGTNSVGTQSTPCLFHILPAEKPSLVKNCEITNMTYDSLSLCCSPGHDGGLRQSFLLQVYDISSGVLLRNITSEEPQFIVWGLSGSNVVSISVKAFNKKGSSEPFTLTSNLLKHPQRHTVRPLWVRLLGGKRPLVAGQSTELVCQAVGARPKPNISWWKGGTRLKTVRETTSSDGNMTSSILTFVPSIKDAGRVLSCRAVQPRLALSTHEDGWKLEIQHMPVVKLELGANLDADKVIEGSDVYLDCMVRANPWHSHVYFTHNEPMSYQWWFNSTTHSKLELNSFTTNTQNNIGRYLYTVNSSSDYGWIQCTGTNSVGTQSTPCLFHILPAEKPSLVKNCEITNMTYDSLSLCCSPGHDGGLRQSFLLQVYDISSGVLLRNITSEEPQFIVWGLSGSNVVSISVKAFNKKGSSEPFTLTSNLLKHPQRHTANVPVRVELTTVLVSVLATVAVIMILTAVTAIVFCWKYCSNDDKNDKTNHKQDEISNIPLTGTNECESVDSLDKNPDIIPIEGKISDNCSNKSSATDYSSIRPLLSKSDDKYDHTDHHYDHNDPCSQYVQVRPLDFRLHQYQHSLQMTNHGQGIQNLGPMHMPNVGPNDCRAPYDKVYENWLKYKNSLPLNTSGLLPVEQLMPPEMYAPSSIYTSASRNPLNLSQMPELEPYCDSRTRSPPVRVNADNNSAYYNVDRHNHTLPLRRTANHPLDTKSNHIKSPDINVKQPEMSQEYR